MSIIFFAFIMNILCLTYGFRTGDAPPPKVYCKYCKYCQFYTPGLLNDINPALCLKFPIDDQETDLVTGKIIDDINNYYNPLDGFYYEYCSVARAVENKCGSSGKRFILSEEVIYELIKKLNEY
jgi:hypothetical protein